MKDSKYAAILQTQRGLEIERDYLYQQGSVSVSVYPIISVDGSSFFVVFSDHGKVIAKKEFDMAWDAAYCFTTTVWKLMDK